MHHTRAGHLRQTAKKVRQLNHGTQQFCIIWPPLSEIPSNTGQDTDAWLKRIMELNWVQCLSQLSLMAIKAKLKRRWGEQVGNEQSPSPKNSTHATASHQQPFKEQHRPLPSTTSRWQQWLITTRLCVFMLSCYADDTDESSSKHLHNVVLVTMETPDQGHFYSLSTILRTCFN